MTLFIKATCSMCTILEPGGESVKQLHPSTMSSLLVGCLGRLCLLDVAIPDMHISILYNHSSFVGAVWRPSNFSLYF
jgi:hypothetical protein